MLGGGRADCEGGLLTHDAPPLLLIHSHSESWWGFEKVMPLLAARFQVYAVDQRGQGRSSRTPGAYSTNQFGQELVREMARLRMPKHQTERPLKMSRATL